MSKRTVKRIGLVLLAMAGYGLLLPVFRALLRKWGVADFRILTYHSVGDCRRHETNVSAGSFDAQMAFLAAQGSAVRLADAIKNYADGRELPNPSVAVTLDDGYADNLAVAAPVLLRYGVKATCFVAAGYAGTRNRLPHDGDDPQSTARLLSWDEVRRWQDQGMDVGSHGLQHGRLSRMGHEDLGAELMRSKELLERETGRPVTLFSYPYGRRGDYDGRAVELARNAGYNAAFTARYGWNRRATERFELRRIGVESSDTLFTFRAKLNGALDLLALCESRWCRKAIGLFNRNIGA